MNAHHPARRTIVAAIKIGLAAAILLYLVRQAQQHDAFSRLLYEPKQWGFLAAGLASTFIAMTTSFVRWHVLVRAVGIESRFWRTLRLATLGFMLNFVSLGSIGGDVFRAIFLARDQPGQRAHAVASVIADRVMGLMTQLSLASGGILAAGLLGAASRELVMFARIILLVTAAAWIVALLVLAIPALSGERVTASARNIPLVGQTIAQLIEAVRAYRDGRSMLVGAAALSVVGVLFYISSYYLVARGLPVREPTWTQHLIVVPMASLAGAIPATPNGLGTLEAAIEVLYQAMPGPERAEKGDGTLVALAHRLTMMAVALVGMIYYFTHRAEVREMITEAEVAEEKGDVFQ